MKNEKSTDVRLAWIVSSVLFLVTAFYFTFVLNNISQGIIWFGAAFAFFTLANNSVE